MSNKTTGSSELRSFIAERAVKRGSFTLASGRKSDVYIDARLATMDPKGLLLIGEAGLEAITAQNWKPDAIGGLTMGADPVAFSISYTSAIQNIPIRAFSVRKQAKEHGTGNRIEGPFQTGDRVVVVEDVITTGQSALQAIDAVTAAGGNVVGILAVVDRMEGGREAINSRGYDVLSLTTKDDLLALK